MFWNELNTRQVVLRESFAVVEGRNPSGPMHVMEVGCMYRSGEGDSTRVLARHLHRRGLGGRLDSADINGEAVAFAAGRIDRWNGGNVALRVHESDGLAVLKSLQREGCTLDLVLLDGSGDPALNLQEFEVAASMLAPHGVIVVDDVVPFPPTKAFPGPRRFGKAMSILHALTASDELPITAEIVGNSHRVLIAGAPDVVAPLRATILKRFVPFPARVAYWVKRRLLNR